MCSVDIVICKGIRVSETQIHVGLRGKVEDGIDVVSLQTVHDFGGVRDVAMVEAEISFVVENAGIVQRRTVVQLVEGDDIVGIWVCQNEMSR